MTSFARINRLRKAAAKRINMALLGGLFLIAPFQETPVDPTLANIKTGVVDAGIWPYVTAGLFIALVVFLAQRLLARKRT